MNFKVKQFYNIFRYDIWRFIKNIWHFRHALINTYTFDYSGSLHYLRTHLEMMEPVLRDGYHVHGQRTANRVKICKLLLDRILDSSDQHFFDHYELDKSEGGWKVVRTPRYSEAPRDSKLQRKILVEKREQDFQLLMKMLTKHWRGFWD